MIVNDTLEYGFIKDKKFHAVRLNIKGRPTPTGVTHAVDPEGVRRVVWWNGGIAGEGESFFPHPEAWRLTGIDKPLDKVEVHDLTKAFSLRNVKPPTCIAKWEQIVGPLDWRGIGARYAAGLQTPKDFSPHFKLLLHRTMRTRDASWNHTSCCLCKGPTQTLHHWATCVVLRPIFEGLRLLDGGSSWDDVRLNLFGAGGAPGVAIAEDGTRVQTQSLGTIPPGVSMVHFIVWKFIFIAITTYNIKGTPISVTQIIENAQRRVEQRMGGQ